MIKAARRVRLCAFCVCVSVCMCVFVFLHVCVVASLIMDYGNP